MPKSVLLFLFFNVWALVAAQSISAFYSADLLYVSLPDLARALGYSLSETGPSLTVRSERGVLVVFEQSADALWQAEGSSLQLDQSEVTLSAPALRRSGELFVPEDVLTILDIGIAENRLSKDGRGLALVFEDSASKLELTTLESFERLELAGGVRALSLYLPGAAGPDSVHALLLDVRALSTLFPAQQGSVEAFLARVDGAPALYFLLAASVPSSWKPEVTIRQGNETATLRYPFDIRLLEGEVGWVSARVPVAGVLLLPERFDLRQPLRFEWSEVRATMTFADSP